MNIKTATEKFLGGAFVTVVELRRVEAKKNEAKPEKQKGESHYQLYKVLVGDDSADVMHYSRGGSIVAPMSLTFVRGQRAVVVGKFQRNQYGTSCMCDSIELLTADEPAKPEIKKA
jgi:hypothetical protein